MTHVRWQFEIAKMRLAYPSFEPILKSPYATFIGPLRGKSGRVYEIRLKVSYSIYPSDPPRVFIAPWVGPEHLREDGSLCVNRVDRPWDPSRDTFAQQVLYAAAHLGAHG